MIICLVMGFMKPFIHQQQKGGAVETLNPVVIFEHTQAGMVSLGAKCCRCSTEEPRTGNV